MLPVVVVADVDDIQLLLVEMTMLIEEKVFETFESFFEFVEDLVVVDLPKIFWELFLDDGLKL